MPSLQKLDETFLQVAINISQLSNCVSYQVGSVIVKDGRIISMGYNGTPAGFTNCSKMFPNYNSDTQREEHHIFSEKYEIHSEQNSLLYSAKNGININDATLYCTLQPCNTCLKMLCQSGIKRIVYMKKYDKCVYDDITYNFLDMCNVKLEQINI